jgi:translation initiation factor IF-1
MDKEEEKKETVTGVVTEALPNTQFRVKVGTDQEVLAYLAGRMRIHRIRVLVGDKVEMVLDDYGGRGRITRRF